MAKKILVAGSLHYDVVVSAARMPKPDETLAGQSVRYEPGGKGRNQAVAAARNGATVWMAGRVGDGTAGQALKDDLVRQGVDVSLLQVGGHEATGMSVAIATPTGAYGAVTVSGSNLDFDTDEVELPDDTGLLVLQNEITDAANIRMAAKARTAGALVLLNAAPARPLDAELAALVDILVVNRSDAEILSDRMIGDLQDAMQAVSALCELVPKALITLSADGVAHMRRGGRAAVQPSFRAELVSAHGAGDFFIGALVAQMVSGSEFEAAIHYAQAGAAIFISTDIDKRDGIRPVHIRARLGEDDQ